MGRFSSNTMRERRHILVLVGCFLGLLACTALTSEDEARLTLLRQRHGARFSFTASDIYLAVRARTAEPAAWDEWVEIYRAFWFTGGRGPRSSSLIYMNVYDSEGIWQGQFSWDPSDRQITFEHQREHY